MQVNHLQFATTAWQQQLIFQEMQMKTCEGLFFLEHDEG